MRTCVGCRLRTQQAALVRVTAAADGSLRVGRSLPGRGAWLCRNDSLTEWRPEPGCVERAARQGSLKRAFRRPVEPEAVRALIEEPV